MTAPSDLELVKAAQTGDSSAFRMLVERYEAQIAATVISMLGPGAEADDVGQETFIRFYNNLDNFRGESSPGTYITRIAINLSFNALKRRQRMEKHHVPLEHAQRRASHDPGYESKEKHEKIHAALKQLEPKFRAVVVLRFLQGYSTKETAKLLKIPQGSVLSRLARAQEKLKHYLKPYIGDDYES